MRVDRNATDGNASGLVGFVAPLGLLLLLAVALVGAWMARSAPRDPFWAQGLLRLDGLAACWSTLTVALALTTLWAPAGRTEIPAPSSSLRLLLIALILCVAYLATHVALLSAALVAVALLSDRRRWEGWAAALLAGGALTLIAVRAGTWRYPAPDAGLGLNSVSFGLIFGATLLAIGAPALAAGRAPRPLPFLAIGLVYTLYRLFSFGPWNLGWQLAALLLGAAVALGAAWQIAVHPDAGLLQRLVALQIGLALIGGGLASGAGLALGVYALLALVVQQAALDAAPASGRQLWLVSGAVPFTAPFVAGWIGVAGAMAGGITVLAMALWAALLLAAAGIARLAEATADHGSPTGDHGYPIADQRPATSDQRPATTDIRSQTADDQPSSVVRPPSSTPDLRNLRFHLASARPWLAPIFSLALGIAAPAVFALLIQPLVAQLQGGLTPFGEVTLWPWAGLLALNAARQPVATLPSLALAGLMVILAALAWLITQFIALKRAEESASRE